MQLLRDTLVAFWASSLWGEEVPPGILTPAAKLRVPPENIAPAALLPATLPSAWKNETTNAAAIATALSHQSGVTLPWKNVASAISAAITGRFLSLTDDSSDWPCEFAMASKAKFTVVSHSEAVESAGHQQVATKDLQGSDSEALAKSMVSELSRSLRHLRATRAWRVCRRFAGYQE